MKKKIMNHITKILKCDEHLFNTNIHQLIDDDKEKLLIYNKYYNFINNDTCILFIENCVNILDKNEHKVKAEKNDILVLSIIILKSFLDKIAIGRHSTSYIESDDIFYYIKREYKMYKVWSKQYIKDRSIETLILHALALLSDYKLISKNSINIDYKTIVHYKISNIVYEKKIEEYFLYSYSKFSIINNDDIYVTTHHYSKTYNLCKENVKSDKKFIIKNKEYIMNKMNIQLYSDKEYQENMKKFLKIDKELIMHNIKENIEYIELLFKTSNWTSETKKEIADHQAKISNDINLLLYDYFSHFDFEDIPIYFPIFLDFRGRKYYRYKINPTSSKILRSAFHYGYYNEDFFKEEDNKYSIPYYDWINSFCDKFMILNERKYYESYFWIIIGIGKNFINKNKLPNYTEDFLIACESNFDKHDLIKIEDILEYEHYKTMFRKMNEKPIKMRPIEKDTPGSLFQINIKINGALNQNALIWVNLGPDNAYYCIYSVHAKLFYEHICENIKETKKIFGENDNNYFKKFQDINEFNKYMNRNYIKKPVMTIPYSAGDETCFRDYEKAIEEKKSGIKLDPASKFLLSRFFKFVRKDVQKILYKTTTDTMVEKIVNEFGNNRSYVLESDTGIADISYYKRKKGSIDKKYILNDEKKRITKIRWEMTNALDLNNFIKASSANTIHFWDADEVREIETILGFSMITIHDAYLVPMGSVTKLIDAKISIYQKAVGSQYTVNNIFILL